MFWIFPQEHDLSSMLQTPFSTVEIMIITVIASMNLEFNVTKSTIIKMKMFLHLASGQTTSSFYRCTWISMSVTVKPSFSRLSLTLRRNLPNRLVSPSSSSSFPCPSLSSSSSSSFTLFVLAVGCGQYSSHFWTNQTKTLDVQTLYLTIFLFLIQMESNWVHLFKFCTKVQFRGTCTCNLLHYTSEENVVVHFPVCNQSRILPFIRQWNTNYISLWNVVK